MQVGPLLWLLHEQGRGLSPCKCRENLQVHMEVYMYPPDPKQEPLPLEPTPEEEQEDAIDDPDEYEESDDEEEKEPAAGSAAEQRSISKARSAV